VDLIANKTAFTGGIRTDNFGLLHQALREWIGVEFNVKVKLTGEQLTYKDDRLSIYCYRAYSEHPGNNEFLIEGRTAAGLDITKHQLEMLFQRLQAAGVSSDFEYSALDEAGKSTGESFLVPGD